MSLHDGAAALLRVRPGSRRPALVWARLAFDGSGEATVLDRSHPEVAVLARSGGVYTLGVPRAAHYQPAGPVALLGAASPFPKLSEPDFAGGTIKATFIDAATPPTSTTGTLLLLGFTGEPFPDPVAVLTERIRAIEGLRGWFADEVEGAGTAGFRAINKARGGPDGTQATTSAQPTASGGVLNFAAASAQFFSVLASALGLEGATKAAIIVRAASTAEVPPSARHMINASSAGGVAFGQLLNVSGDCRFSFAGGATQTIPGASIAATAENVLTLLFDSGQQSVRLNGTQIVTGAAGIGALPVMGSIRIGGTTGVFWDGTMRHVFIVVGRIPTEAELQLLEGFKF